MQTLLIECAIRVTLIAAIITLVLFAMRIKTASVLHAVWAGVVVVMMLLPAWVTWGPKASFAILPPDRTSAVALLPPPLPAGLADATPRTRPVSNPVPSPARQGGGYIAIYLFGVGVFLLRLAIGTIRARRLTNASCVVPVTVGLLHPRIILPKSAHDWPQAQLDAVLAHEGEHIRRRDPLFQWIALFNRAIFWFHPLAWWLERRLSGLAEEACDAAVLAQGHDPRDYSAYLLDLARSVERAGTRIEAVGMAMPGIGLKHRIRQILSGVTVPRISRPRIACTVAVCAGAAAILAAGTLVRAQVALPAFDVTSVKLHPRGQPSSGEFGCSNGRFVSNDNRLGETILWAYNLKLYQVIGIPDWVESAYSEYFYDIEAKAAPSVTEAQCRLMVRSLLADRFKMVSHREQKESLVYALVVAKNGPKMKRASDDDTTPGINVRINGNPMGTPPGTPKGARRSTGWSMATLSDFLSIAQLGRPIIDRTGLEGFYKISLDFSISFPRQPDYVPPPDSGPDIRAALQQQLGLRLEDRKAPIEMLVIDHIEKPDPN